MTGEDGDSKTSRQIQLEEARRHLDRQAAEVELIDEKATRTVRYVILGLAALATVFTFGPSAPEPNWIIAAGVALLLLAVLAGVLTYSSSRIYVSSTAFFNKSIPEDSPDLMRMLILSELADNAADNQEAIEGDELFLSLMQFLFFLGVVVTAVGIWNL